jgi:hypothetical protein
MQNAIGFVETRGYVAAFAAADAMVKAANVRGGFGPRHPAAPSGRDQDLRRGLSAS